jgi:hypothetical protein
MVIEKMIEEKDYSEDNFLFWNSQFLDNFYASPDENLLEEEPPYCKHIDRLYYIITNIMFCPEEFRLREVVKLIMDKFKMSEQKALDAFYSSATGASFADDDTGLYGQSPYFIFGLYEKEMDEKKMV